MLSRVTFGSCLAICYKQRNKDDLSSHLYWPLFQLEGKLYAWNTLINSSFSPQADVDEAALDDIVLSYVVGSVPH